MIENFLVETCKVLVRQIPPNDSWKEFQFIPSQEYNCLGIGVTDEQEMTDVAENVVERKVLFLGSLTGLKGQDKILYDGYEWDIEAGGIRKLKDMIDGSVRYYRVAIMREEKYADATVIDIKEVV